MLRAPCLEIPPPIAHWGGGGVAQYRGPSVSQDMGFRDTPVSLDEYALSQRSGTSRSPPQSLNPWQVSKMRDPNIATHGIWRDFGTPNTVNVGSEEALHSNNCETWDWGDTTCIGLEDFLEGFQPPIQKPQNKGFGAVGTPSTLKRVIWGDTANPTLSNMGY